MKIERSGMVPCYINENMQIEMMFMKPADPLYGGSDYQIAKGKIEVGESPLETAIRESHEELGLTQRNIIDTFYCGKFLGRTYIFAALVKSKDDFDPYHEDETASVTWMTLDEFEQCGRDIHREVIDCVCKDVLSLDPSLHT